MGKNRSGGAKKVKKGENSSKTPKIAWSCYCILFFFWYFAFKVINKSGKNRVFDHSGALSQKASKQQFSPDCSERSVFLTILGLILELRFESNRDPQVTHPRAHFMSVWGSFFSKRNPSSFFRRDDRSLKNNYDELGFARSSPDRSTRTCFYRWQVASLLGIPSPTPRPDGLLERWRGPIAVFSLSIGITVRS